MSINQFREILIWRMCSDPWPGGDIGVIDSFLDTEAYNYGCSDWVEAYHKLC